MPAFGRMPTRFVEGQQQLSASEMTNWVQTTRALAATSGLSGAVGYRGGSGAATAVRHVPKYPVLAPLGLVWVRVSGYRGDKSAYLGRRVSPDTEGELTCPAGFKWSYLDEEDIELHIMRGTPSGETDVRAYWPRLLANGTTEWWGWAVLRTVATAEDWIQRWYIVPPFGPWCEDEARPGVVPDLGKPPVVPGPPAPIEPPGGFAPEEGPFRPPGAGVGGDGDDDLQRLIRERNGGRPCGGCPEE